MGYSTEFRGKLKFNRALTNDEIKYINNFSDSRRMGRDITKLTDITKGLPVSLKPDAKAVKHICALEKLGFEVNLTKKQINDNRTLSEIFGANGEYYVGNDYIGATDVNSPPKGQPGLWCSWHIEGTRFLAWNGTEKFYNYIEWLKYLINEFFEKWNLILNGEIEWQGDDSSDLGKIIVVNNEVTIKTGKITYE